MGSYKLTVGGIEGILYNKESAKVTINKVDYYVMMESLDYRKRIFAPGEIHTVLSMKLVNSNSPASFPGFAALQNVFSRQLVSLAYGDEADDQNVAENYFVFKMKPCQSKNASGSAIKVELFIYSLDKLLTIDKYCNAFTAKKLGEEIFKYEISKFRVGGQTLTGDVNLQILTYTSKIEQEEKTDGGDATTYKVVEVRQPYLVQYNESFYDFMARSASRCGEMLYFENGLLHLGMSPDLSKANIDQTTVAENVDYEDCMDHVLNIDSRHYDFFERGEDDDNRYVDSVFELLGAVDDKAENNSATTTSGKKEDGKVTEKTTTSYKGGTEVKEVTTTYYVDKDVEPQKQLKGLPKEKVTTTTLTDKNNTILSKVTQTVVYHYELGSDNKYKKEGKEFVYTTETTQTVNEGKQILGIYNQPEPYDALFNELKKNGYTSYFAEWEDFRVILLNVLFLKIVNASSIYDCIEDLGVDLAKAAIDAGSSVLSKNWDNNQTNLTLSQKDHPDQVKDDTYNLFSTLKDAMDDKKNLVVNQKGNEVQLLVAAFYAKIREASREVSQYLVRLNYGATDQRLCLGDVIKVGTDDFYVVTKVELDENKDYIVEAIPPFYKDVQNSTIKTFIPCPPFMPDIPSVRTSEPQVAFVENNLDPNQLGRVRIKYPWQTTTDESSPWVRMATPFATNGGGVTFKPENGDEVLLNYEDGNIERPYVVGSLQSKYVTDHWGKLEDRVIQSRNGHSIVFKDEEGLGFFTGLVPGLDYIKGVLPMASSLVDCQETNDLCGGIEIKDRYGLYKIDLSSNGRSVTIESPMGNIDLNAFTGITVSAPNGTIEIKGKNVSIAASNKLTLESGSAVSERFVGKPSWDNLKELADKTIGEFIDLTFLRTVIEVFTRPVDGTLKVKSNTYVLIEAGQGTTQIPRNDYAKPDKEISRGNSYLAQEPLLGNMKKTIDLLISKADSLCGDIKTSFVEVQNAAKEYKAYKIENNVVYDKLTKMKLDGNDSVVKKVFDERNNQNFDIKTIIKEDDKDDFGFDSIDEFKFRTKDKNPPEEPTLEDFGDPYDFIDAESSWKTENEKFKDDKKRDEAVLKVGRDKFVELAQNLGVKLKALYDAVGKWKNFDFDSVKPAATQDSERDNAYYTDTLMTTVRGLDIFQNFIANVDSGTVDIDKDIVSTYDQELSKLHRAMVYELIVEAKDNDTYKALFSVSAPVTKPDFGNDEEWSQFAEKIGEPVSTPSVVSGVKGMLGKVGSPIRDYFLDNLVNPLKDSFANPVNNQQKWTAPEKGRILLSDMPGRTIHFDADQLVTNSNYGDVTTAHPLVLKRKVNSVK